MMNNWNWQNLATTGSTNDDALNFSKVTECEKFIITADAQNNGRGRRGRSWLGYTGNLFMSLGVKVELKDIGQLVFVVGLSLAEAIKGLSADNKVEIKWPNDVLVNDKKISGMLLEKAENDFMIIGIGVNIKHSPKDDSMIYPATSMIEEGVDIEKFDFMNKFLLKFDFYYNIWQEQGFELIKQRWLLLAKGIGKNIYINMDGGVKEGEFVGVDDNGLLLINKCGIDEKIYAGDVFFSKGK